MPAAFREVFAAFGVDDDRTPPAMIAPVRGSNVVALAGGEDLIVKPERDNIKVTPRTRQEVMHMVLFNHLAAKSLGAPVVGGEPRFYEIYGQQAGGPKGTLVNATNPKTKKTETSLRVMVLGRKTVKIAIRPVRVPDAKGGWDFHATKQFDAKELVDQMNAIWTPQANIDFDLVSTDPVSIEQKDLTRALEWPTDDKTRLPDEINIQAFAPVFIKHKAPRADFTIFMVKRVLDRALGHQREKPDRPVAATMPTDAFALAGDNIGEDLVRASRKLSTPPGLPLAHEAGHFIGSATDRPYGHPYRDGFKGGTMLMQRGGPTAGPGKIPFEDTISSFNQNWHV